MNTNMRLIAFILILITPSWAVAAKYMKGIKFSDVSPIYVDIADYASGGCWTNLKEVKTYASDKIELAGGVLTESIDEVTTGAKGIGFIILVNARRHKNLGICYGNISVTTESFGTAPQFPDYFGLVTYSQKGLIVTDGVNFNKLVLDTVSKAIAEWKD